MPEVTDDLQEDVRSMGRRVRTISFPSAAARNGLIVPPKVIEPKKSIALFGYLVIMLYKNVTEVCFRRFSEQFLKALFDAAGFTPSEGEDVSIFNDVEHAMCYRNSYGHNHVIRKAVLKGILNHTEDKDSFGVVCSYVADIFKWTDMATFVCIRLSLSNSPVMRAPELADEVENLTRASKAVADTEKLWYYMISENHESYSILDISNFPMLIDVAEKIKANAEICKVDYFVAMHRNHFGGASNLFADNNEDEDEED